MKIISINLGLPGKVRYGQREFDTGGNKHAVPSAMLRTLNFEGDGQADLINHGGADKAVCVYAYDLYSHWEGVLGRTMQPGAFSENLTVAGAVDEAIHIGDVFEIGEALVQVSQTRMPCGKLAARNGHKNFVPMVQAKDTGFYMRVLREGQVRAGDAFVLVEPHRDAISIAAVNALLYGRSTDKVTAAALFAMDEFAETGKAMVAHKLAA